MNGLISVIIPIYNVDQYLDHCIRSVANQTYNNLEIILVDDGSSDRSGTICDEWSEKDSRIRVIHQENRGVSAARNTGMEISCGDYIGFIDSDDWCEETMYEELQKSISENTSDIALCGFCDYPTGMARPIKRGVVPHEKCSNIEAIIPILESGGYFVSIWNKLYRRNSIIKDGKIIQMDTELQFGEDETWLYEVLANSKSVSFVPKPLYNWRPREGSVTRDSIITDQHMSLLKAKKRILNLAMDFNPMENYIKAGIYNDCYLLKILAYCSDKGSYFEEVKTFLQPLRRFFLRAENIRFPRKLKVLILDLCMSLKMPKKTIEILNKAHGK